MSPTTGLHASKVKKHLINFLLIYIAHFHIFKWFSNDLSDEKSLLSTSYSTLIGQMAQSVVIGLPLTASLETKHHYHNWTSAHTATMAWILLLRMRMSCASLRFALWEGFDRKTERNSDREREQLDIC